MTWLIVDNEPGVADLQRRQFGQSGADGRGADAAAQRPGIRHEQRARRHRRR